MCIFLPKAIRSFRTNWVTLWRRDGMSSGEVCSRQASRAIAHVVRLAVGVRVGSIYVEARAHTRTHTPRPPTTSAVLLSAMVRRPTAVTSPVLIVWTASAGTMPPHPSLDIILAIANGISIVAHTLSTSSWSGGRVGLRRRIKAPIPQGARVRIPSWPFSFSLHFFTHLGFFGGCLVFLCVWVLWVGFWWVLWVFCGCFVGGYANAVEKVLLQAAG